MYFAEPCYIDYAHSHVLVTVIFCFSFVQPFAWDSREFLRKLIVGKEIMFSVEYKVCMLSSFSPSRPPFLLLSLSLLLPFPLLLSLSNTDTHTHTCSPPLSPSLFPFLLYHSSSIVSFFSPYRSQLAYMYVSLPHTHRFPLVVVNMAQRGSKWTDSLSTSPTR